MHQARKQNHYKSSQDHTVIKSGLEQEVVLARNSSIASLGILRRISGFYILGSSLWSLMSEDHTEGRPAA